MSQALAFAVLLVCLAALLQASAGLESTNWTRDFTIATSNASTVPFNGRLYTVAKNQSHIRVNSSSSSAYQPCEIAIDAARDVSQGRLEVTPTDEEIFVVGVRSIAADGERYKYTILRVDPRACGYAAADVPETNDSRGGYFMPRLVRHPTGTDVFFPSLRNCAPCRLDNAGLRAAAIPQIARETGSPGVPFHVRYLHSANAYFYVYNSFNLSSSIETTTLRLLDKADFRAKKERIVHFPVHAVSRQKKSNGHLGVCTKTLDDFMADISAYTEVRCDRLNAAGNLETTSSVRVPIEPHSEPISSISYEFDDQGNSYLSYAEDTKLRLYVHDGDGKLVKAIDMGMVDDRFQHYPDDQDPMEFDAYEYWDVNGFLLGDEYCIVTGQVSTHYPSPLEQVRCIDVSKYVKH